MSTKVLTDYKDTVRDQLIKSLEPFIKNSHLEERVREETSDKEFIDSFMGWSTKKRVLWLLSDTDKRQAIQLDRTL